MKWEGRGSVAKSWAEAKSISGTKIIPPSFVVLTNPGSACATSTPRDRMLYDGNKDGNGQRFKAAGSW